MLSSLTFSVGGTGVGGGEGVGGGYCWIGVAKQVSQVQSHVFRYCAAFKSSEHFVCIHPEHMLHL